MRIKLIKNHRLGKTGEVIHVSKNVGFGLIDSGFGKLTKDMTSDDYQQAGVNYGQSSKLRTYKSK